MNLTQQIESCHQDLTEAEAIVESLKTKYSELRMNDLELNYGYKPGMDIYYANKKYVIDKILFYRNSKNVSIYLKRYNKTGGVYNMTEKHVFDTAADIEVLFKKNP